MPFDAGKYNADYVRTHYRQIMVKISKEREADIIEWLEKQENMQDYIRSLIRQDMEKHART